MTDIGWDGEDLSGEDLAFDHDIFERLHAELDEVGPSEEAENRMLANLLAAQASREQAGQQDARKKADHDDVPILDWNDDIDYVELPDKQQSGGFTLVTGKRRRVSRNRTIGLAVAASVMLAVLGLSVGTFLQSSKSDSANYMQETQAASDAGAGALAEEAPGVDALSSTSEAAPMDAEEKDSAAEEEELEFFDAAGGAFDVTSDPSYELAVNYPEIHLYTGEVLRIVEHLGEPVIIGDEWVETFVGDAEAHPEDGLDSVKCWVYSLPVSNDGLFVVRYVEGGSCYAVRIER